MTTVDRIIALVEPYALARAEEKRLRRAMQAERCEREKDLGVRCYAYRHVDGGCAACQRRTAIWREFAALRRQNRAALRRIERLALRLSLPDPIALEEPKPLLDMMVEAEKTARAFEAFGEAARMSFAKIEGIHE